MSERDDYQEILGEAGLPPLAEIEAALERRLPEEAAQAPPDPASPTAAPPAQLTPLPPATTQHIEEELSRAYIQAVAAKAGTNLALRERSHDYTIDGTFHQVSVLDDRLHESGFSLHFQLKASRNVQISRTHAVFDLDVDTYNYLVARADKRNAERAILAVFAMPKRERDWLSLSETRLVLKKCCYWLELKGVLSINKATRRVKLPRTQLLTPDAVVAMLDAIERNGKLP